MLNQHGVVGDNLFYSRESTKDMTNTTLNESLNVPHAGDTMKLKRHALLSLYVHKANGIFFFLM